MREEGLHYDHETALDGMHTHQRVAFTVLGFPWAFDVKLPKRIDKVLTTADWDRTVADAKKHCEELIERHFFIGDNITRKVIENALHIRIANRLHERFIDHQEHAGNEAWARPEAMRKGLILAT